jgi:hypothetical protein
LNRKIMRACVLGLLTICALATAPAIRADDAILHVSYAGKTLAFTAADLAAMPHQTITAMDTHEKASHAYTGVPVRDLLARVDAPSGEKLRGPALRLVVIARALDNYEVAYALAEFDGAFNDRTILLVDRQDGQPLGAGMGPLRLLVPGDKRPARWTRMITSLDIIQVGEDRH